MSKYIHDKYGTYEIDFFCVIEDGKTTYNVWKHYGDGRIFLGEHTTKVYYRPERTWDDHMGNTPCGYYVNVPLPDGRKKRVYYS